MASDWYKLAIKSAVHVEILINRNYLRVFFDFSHPN